MTALPIFPPPIRRYVADFVARASIVRLVRAILIGLALILASTLLVSLDDRLFAFSPTVRASLLLLQRLAALAIIARPALDLLRRNIDWIDASQQIERRDPT